MAFHLVSRLFSGLCYFALVCACTDYGGIDIYQSGVCQLSEHTRLHIEQLPSIDALRFRVYCKDETDELGPRTNDVFTQISHRIDEQRTIKECVSSYYYAGVLNDVSLTADQPLFGREAGEDLSDMFILSSQNRVKEYLRCSFPGYDKVFSLSEGEVNERIDLQSFYSPGTSMDTSCFVFESEELPDVSPSRIILTLSIPVVAESFECDSSVLGPPKVVKRFSFSTILTASMIVSY